MIGCKAAGSSDVVGTWTLTAQSRQGLPIDFRNALTRIVVSADESFVASELPEELYPLPPYEMKARMRLDSGSGLWRIVSSDGAQRLELEFQTLAGEHKDGRYSFPLTISKGWSTVSLSYFLGDPDQAQRIDLERK